MWAFFEQLLFNLDYFKFHVFKIVICYLWNLIFDYLSLFFIKYFNIEEKTNPIN